MVMVAEKPREKQVYSTRSHVRRRSTPQQRGAAASAFIGMDGKRHLYLNAAIPCGLTRKQLDVSICECCGHGYTHVLVERRRICNECQIEQSAERAKRLEEQGIPLGWGYTERERDLCRDHASIKRRAIESTDDHSYHGQIDSISQY